MTRRLLTSWLPGESPRRHLPARAIGYGADGATVPHGLLMDSRLRLRSARLTTTSPQGSWKAAMRAFPQLLGQLSELPTAPQP